METKSSPYFTSIPLYDAYNRNINGLTKNDCTETVLENRQHLLTGSNILWGMPFHLGRNEHENNVLLLKDEPVEFHLPEISHDRYIVFLHTVDFKQSEDGEDGIVQHHMGNPRLGETVAEYELNYSDGTQHTIPIRRRFNISEFKLRWGEDSFECVPHTKPQAFRSNTEEFIRGEKVTHIFGIGAFHTAAPGYGCEMQHWLYAAENPYPEKELISITFIPKDGTVFIFGITGGSVPTNPIRWDAAKRLKLRLPDGVELNEFGDYDDLDIDLGCIVTTFPLRDYDNDNWEKGYNNKPPKMSTKEVLVEYYAHPQANIYIGQNNPRGIQLSSLDDEPCHAEGFSLMKAIKPNIPVKICIYDDKTGLPVSAKLHIHSIDGEYLAPMNRHRFPNPHWFEDYSVDFTNDGHSATYVDGSTVVLLPEGEVFIEVSKGFEIKPVKVRQTICRDTETIDIGLERVLNWRAKGWVSADTHVHFLTPNSALLEGSGEGVNIVNLLASQWGELFTNVGDFDGATTLASQEAGSAGEYLVRVGTENRQHILGHISLLGYEGDMILPLTTGGTDESRLGDPLENSTQDWARQCRRQNGLAILPHFPNPRAEGAAALVMELIDGVEMTSWGAIFAGINPYSLSDWYRYLNCGFMVPAVGGTDKMTAETPVGGVRTYALIKDKPFTYENWKEVVRSGLTFATYGPLLDFHINSHDMGSTVQFGDNGGTVEIDWRISSVTIPVTKAELVFNGELRELKELDPEKMDHSGSWSVKVKESGWFALRVRGKHPDREEIIAAHSSTVSVRVGNKPIFNKLDAMTILDQIEGTTAYVKNLGSKADETKYRQLMENLTAAHRKLHNYLHQNGIFHDHNVVEDHHK